MEGVVGQRVTFGGFANPLLLCQDALFSTEKYMFGRGNSHLDALVAKHLDIWKHLEEVTKVFTGCLKSCGQDLWLIIRCLSVQD